LKKILTSLIICLLGTSSFSIFLPAVSAVPSLSGGYVSPSSGTTSTLFHYYVNYFDPGGLAPDLATVVVDGNTWIMTLWNGVPSNGQYHYATTLSLGTHNFYFMFTAGAHTLYLPLPSNPYSGPTVTGPLRRLRVYSAHDSPIPANGDWYYTDGQWVTCSVTSPVIEDNIEWTCTGWAGTGSVPPNTGGTIVSFQITQDSEITWTWVGSTPTYTLTVTSAHDSPIPSNGPHTYNHGDPVTCSVTSPVVEGDTLWTCTGWTGTGSVSPPTGSGTVVSFTITQDSSIIWHWQGSTLNDPPNPPTNPNPPDWSRDTPTTVMLSVDVSDPDGDFMDVSFYEFGSQTLIGTETNVPSGGTASVQWAGLSYVTRFVWYAIANDGEGGETYSEIYHFTTDASGREVEIAVILAKFSDNNPAPTHDADYYLTGADPLVSSLERYYFDSSYGTVNLNVKFFTETDGTWKYTVIHDRLYYGAGTTDEQAYALAREFSEHSIDASDGDIGFDLYDIVICVHAGYDKAVGGGQNDMRSAYFDTPYQSPLGDQIENRITIAERDPMGVWAHEIGHAMGKVLTGSRLEDHYGGSLGDIFEWGLMGDGGLRVGGMGTRPTHMSSYNKKRLNWVYPRVAGYGTYELESLETISSGDTQNVLIFYPGGLPFQPRALYYIIECRSSEPSYGQWESEWWAPDNGIVIYEVFWPHWPLSSPEVVNKITLANHNDDESTLNSVGDQFLDPISLVQFSFVQMEARDDGYYSTISIDLWTPLNLIGTTLSQALTEIGWLPVPYNITLAPDLDLHAITDDGKHIGMNYTTGLYENQVAGALTSGDLINADEWIFVPEGTNITFYISSYDVGVFLEFYPEYESQFSELSFNTTSIGFDKNGTRHDVMNETLTITPNSTIPCSTQGSIIVGDVNWDGEVDIFDLVIMSNVYGLTSSDPRWNIECDLDNDDDVDIFDIVLAIRHYGEHW
jgi:M6 family metalloprotease-like protein